MKKVSVLACVFVCLFVLSSCSAVSFRWEKNADCAFLLGKEELSDSEVMLIGLHYKSSFEKYYGEAFGSGFWQETAYEKMNFADYVRNYWILPECKALLILCSMADDEGVRLSDSEEERASRTASEIFRGLNEDEIRFTGATQDAVRDLVEKYMRATLMAERLTAGQKISVSDEESRVADIALIRVSDADIAAELGERLRQEENFLTLAREFSEDRQIFYSVAKGELKEPLNSSVFALSDGEESPVLFLDGSYYLVRIISSYNSILSGQNKNTIAALRRYDGWKPLAEAYEAGRPVRMTAHALERIPLEDPDFDISFDLFSFFQ